MVDEKTEVEEETQDQEEEDQTPEPTEEDIFGEAFDEEEEPAKTEDEEKQDGEDKKKDSAEEDQDGEPEAGDIFEAPEEDDQDSEESEEGSEDETELDKLKKENADITQKMKSWEGRITAANKRAEEAERKLQELTDSTQDKEKAKEKADALPEGEDDDEVLKGFIEEFPSLEKPIKAMATKIARQIVEAKLKDIEPKLSRIDELEKVSEESATEVHWDTIKTAHPDYEEIRDSGKLADWIEKQPSFVKTSLERVVQEGTAAEVVDMFDAYKKSTGSGTSSSTKTGKSKAQKKAQDMAAVDGSSGGPPKRKEDIDKDDFDAAWDDALSKD